MKKLLFLFFIYFSNSVYSNEIKLQCSTNSTYTYHFSGTVERGKGNSIIEITDTGKSKSIFITSDIDVVDKNLVTTYNFTSGSSITFNDFSDNNKWEIKNIFLRDGNKRDVTIKIDRNTGQFFLNSLYTGSNGNTTETNAGGNCEKVDTTKKKF